MQRRSITGQLLGKIVDRVNQRATICARFHVEKQVAAQAIEFREVCFGAISFRKCEAIGFTLGVPGFGSGAVFGFGHAE
jgi:hypothetical protein